MDIINLIFNHIQDEEYVRNSNIIVDKKICNMIADLEDSKKTIDYIYIDELVHNASSIGQYEGFIVGMKTMLDIIRKLG